MSKAEELANKYCEGSSFEDACMEKPAYIAGYHRAEKNLELTWQDIRLISEIGEKFMNSEESDNLSEEEYYTEIFNRFKAQKGEEV